MRVEKISITSLIKANEKIKSNISLPTNQTGIDNPISSYKPIFTGLSIKEKMQLQYKNRNKILTSIENTEKDNIQRNKKEGIIDTLGNIKLIAIDEKDEKTIQRVDKVISEMFKPLLKEKSLLKPVIFVMGHKNPDMDSAISAYAEAIRNNAICDEAIYLPVLQGNSAKEEIKDTLGENLNNFVFSDSDFYKKYSQNLETKWILVDQNEEKEVQDKVIGIIDHHDLSKDAKKSKAFKTCEKTGSTAALITQKLLGSGVKIDKNLAQILYSAALTDTANYNPSKMTFKDELVMKFLKRDAEIKNSDDFYKEIMKSANKPKNAEELFYNDYKQDGFGYSMGTESGILDENNLPLQKKLADLIDLAKINNKKNNLPFTLLDLYDFKSDGITIDKQRIYLIFNDDISQELIQTVNNALIKILNPFIDDAKKITSTENFIEIKDLGNKISRKAISPKIKNILEANN